MARDGKYATIKMPSGENKINLATCSATIEQYQTLIINTVSGKAGRTRWLVKTKN
jgi:large subunit ribosomal protein L2